MNKKAAILAYPNSNNLGDFVQSLAAKQELKQKQPVQLDRDQLHQYEGEAIKLIMNGWFMEHPSHWPPSNKIDPLFLSFHLNPIAKKGMLDQKGIRYLKKQEPIGCRDYHTQELLSNVGIKTYFSACLTLCLNRSLYTQKKKREGIHVISPIERLNPETESVSTEFYKRRIQKLKKPFKKRQYAKAMSRLNSFLKAQDEKKYYSTQLRDINQFSEAERIKEAKKHLKNIAEAKLVITSRIHTALPAVAFNTPVLFLSDGLEHPNQMSRLKGMEQFFPIINSKELVLWKTQRPKPSKAHLPFVSKFQEEILQFLKE